MLNRTAIILLSIALLSMVARAWADSTPPTAADEASLRPAAEYGNDEVIRRLLAKEVDVSGLGDASSALSDAITNKHTSTVKLLLQAGVDPNLTDNSWTPLSTAAEYGSPKMIRLLLRHGADPNLKYEGNTTLCVITSSTLAMGENSEATQVAIAKLLMGAGASASIDEPCASLDGGTPLRGAIKNNGSSGLSVGENGVSIKRRGLFS